MQKIVKSNFVQIGLAVLLFIGCFAASAYYSVRSQINTEAGVRIVNIFNDMVGAKAIKESPQQWRILDAYRHELSGTYSSQAVVDMNKHEIIHLKQHRKEFGNE
ncbi:MAG: hypothetical protein ACWA5R_13805 [bacterium]